jgi:quinol monooxygenase YgiN
MGIDGQVSWVVQCAVKDGQLDAFKELMDEMVESTRDEEAGTLNYEWFISDDNGTVHIYEKYADSAAAMAHMKSFGESWAGRFLGCVDVERTTAYGNPDEAAQKGLAQMGAKTLGHWGGFAR